MLKWLKRTTLNTQDEYWNSIDDMPLWNWIRCSNGQFEWVHKEGKANRKEAEEKWENIYDQYLAKYGLHEKYEKYLELCRQMAMLQCDYVITQDRFKLTEIEIKEHDIKRMEVHFGDGASIETTLIYLSKWLGYKINQKETSVTEYFDIKEEYGRANKKIGDS